MYVGILDLEVMRSAAQPPVLGWDFDLGAAPEGVELLVYRYADGPMPWGSGFRDLASNEGGYWYDVQGVPIPDPACWAHLPTVPPVRGTLTL